MSDATLRPQIYKTLWWLFVVPIAAMWPFISAFPIFGILETTRFDLNTAINSLFALTGFWAILAIVLASWYAMGSNPRANAKTALAHFRAMISFYICLWTCLYMVFVIFR